MNLFIDLADGSVLVPLTHDVLAAAELAKKEGGRLRLVVDKSMSTTYPMAGCIQLGDWRKLSPADATD